MARPRSHATILPSTSACRQLPEISYETEHLHIGTNFETPLCQGNLDHYERVVTRVEAALDTSIDAPIEVYLWDELQGSAPNWCFDDVEGCHGDGVVYSSLGSAEHELVHAVLESIGQPPLFWSEGTAEALQVERTKLFGSDPSDNIDAQTTEELSYKTAGHFSRWVLETFGLDDYRRLVRAKGSAREAFESTYGMSFADAEQQYLAEAPDSYGAFIACEDPLLAQVDGTEWFESVELTCSEPSVYADSRGLYTWRVLAVTERGDYAISMTSARGFIMRCPDEAYEDAPSFEDVEQYGEVPAYTADWPMGYVKGFGDPSQPTTLDLTPGRYLVSASIDGFEPRAVEISVGLEP